MINKEQPPSSDFTTKIRKRWLAEALNQDSTLDYAICAVIDLCDRLDASESHLREYGGQRCTAVCSQCKKINHWCLLGQGHTGEHIHYCQFRTLEASRKELLTACEDGLKDLGRLMMRLDTSEVDSTIRKMQAVIKANK